MIGWLAFAMCYAAAGWMLALMLQQIQAIGQIMNPLAELAGKPELQMKPVRDRATYWVAGALWPLALYRYVRDRRGFDIEAAP